ncbi:MAG: hypothetical protein KDD37_08060 [Bdellovibrionales bacterium]|nr:hypothetical protein [Bdellovibrionales bacterium]
MKALLVLLLLPIIGFAKTDEQQKRDRKYPGGWDEMDIQVQPELPATYKTSRKYYESKLQNPNDNRMPASHDD